MRAIIGVLAAAAVALAGCGSSSQEATRMAVQGAASEVQNARLVAELAAGGKSSEQFLGVLLDDSRETLLQEQGQLAGQPEAAALVSTALAALDELDDAVAAGDRARAGRLATDLGTLGQRLRDLEEAAR